MPALIVCAGIVVSYGAFVAWDQDGSYAWWQIAGLAIVPAALAVWSGRVRAIWPTASAATGALTICFSIDAATDAENDGLWPVGAFLLAAGTLAGFALIASISTAALAQRKSTS
jgi:hypothetical protein